MGDNHRRIYDTYPTSSNNGNIIQQQTPSVCIIDITNKQNKMNFLLGRRFIYVR